MREVRARISGGAKLPRAGLNEAGKLALEEEAVAAAASAPSATAAALALRGCLRLDPMVEADLESFVVRDVEEAINAIVGAFGGGGVEEAGIDEALGDSLLARK
eukprot:jgi/Tetstr1/426714/TSEL_001651.t1